jgi:hypothetical protein
MPDHRDVGGVMPVGQPPVAEQVVHDGVQPLLRRVPRLEQVVVEPDVVDGLDGDVRVRVRGQEHVLRGRRMDTRLFEHLDAGHLGHSLVARDQRHRLVTQGKPCQYVQRLRARCRAYDAVVAAVPAT